MFWLINKIFIAVLTGQANEYNHSKCISLSNHEMYQAIKKCMIQPTLINLHPIEYSQEFHYYPSAVKLDTCVGSCNTLNKISNKVCVLNKAEDLNLSVFNIIAEINESKTLTKHISCERKCRFDGRKCNSDQFWHNDKY